MKFLKAVVSASAVSMFALATPALAAWVEYSIEFTGTGTLPTSGAFERDSATGEFRDFAVTWAGFGYDFTAKANSQNRIQADLLCGTQAFREIVFLMLTQAACMQELDGFTSYMNEVNGRSNPLLDIGALAFTIGASRGLRDAQYLLFVDRPMDLNGEQPSFDGTFIARPTVIDPPVIPVPEPSTLALVGLSLFGAMGSRLSQVARARRTPARDEGSVG